MLKALPIKKKEGPACKNIDLKRDSDSAVRTAGGKEFQQSVDLLKKEEHNLVEPLVGRGVLKKEVEYRD
jgi:hypothetical protein